MSYEYKFNKSFFCPNIWRSEPRAKELTSDECCDGCEEHCKLSVNSAFWYGDVEMMANDKMVLTVKGSGRENDLKALLMYCRKSCAKSKMR